MAPEKQIAANRANAAKSTGPSSPEGRLKSSQNAVRHGLLAQTIVLEGESNERFHLLLETLQDETAPNRGGTGVSSKSWLSPAGVKCPSGPWKMHHQP